jgi:hypothetical protein
MPLGLVSGGGKEWQRVAKSGKEWQKAAKLSPLSCTILFENSPLFSSIAWNTRTRRSLPYPTHIAAANVSIGPGALVPTGNVPA